MKLPFFGRNKQEKKALHLRAFSGAQTGRLTSDWNASSNSQNAEIKSGLIILRNRSRELERNNEGVRGFLRSAELNTIGKGITFQCQILKSNSELDKALNDKIEIEWEKWSRKDSCDVSGMLGFNSIEKLMVRRDFVDGEFIVRMVKQKFGRSKVPFALEIIESDLLDERINGVSDTGNVIKMGVELDSWGRPIFYHFRTSHPGDAGFGVPYQNRTKKVAASEIIHIFTVERSGQVRGYPKTNSVMFTLHQLRGFEEATVVGKRAKASVMGFVQSTDEVEATGDEVINNERVSNLSPGKIEYLKPHETIVVPNLGTDTGASDDAFIATQHRKVATGLGGSYESVSGDFSKTNYSSSRLSIINERDFFRSLQKYYAEVFHQIIFENWLKAAVYAGVIQVPDSYFLDPEPFHQVRWMPRGYTWVDPLKDVSAQILALDKGLKTRSEILAEDGKDFEETMAQLQRENKIMEKYGIKLVPTLINGGSDEQNQNSKTD